MIPFLTAGHIYAGAHIHVLSYTSSFTRSATPPPHFPKNHNNLLLTNLMHNHINPLYTYIQGQAKGD